MTEAYKAKAAIRKAIQEQKEPALRAACFEFESLVWHGFKDSLFNFILDSMVKPDCLRMRGASHLLHLLQSQFRKLSRNQKMKLLDFIQTYYSRLRDRMAWFTISEILGENYCNEDAFNVLCKLSSTRRFEARLFVPHGFEHTIRDSGNIVLSKKALDKLLKMRDDRSKYVRYEVDLSLARVKNHFTLGTDLAGNSLVEVITTSRPSWSYEWESEIRKRMWQEAGIRPLPWENYFGTGGWTTPCCGFSVEINFKFRDKRGGGPRVSWLRSKWRGLDKRLSIACGRCGSRRLPNWGEIVRNALKSAKRLPIFSDGAVGTLRS